MSDDLQSSATKSAWSKKMLINSPGYTKIMAIDQHISQRLTILSKRDKEQPTHWKSPLSVKFLTDAYNRHKEVSVL